MGSPRYLHASCSQPLHVGDEIYSDSKGALIVSGFQSLSGRTDKACEKPYKKIISPKHLTDIVVYDKKGKVIKPFSSKSSPYTFAALHDYDHEHFNADEDHDHYHDQRYPKIHDHGDEHHQPDEHGNH